MALFLVRVRAGGTGDAGRAARAKRVQGHWPLVNIATKPSLSNHILHILLLTHPKFWTFRCSCSFNAGRATPPTRRPLFDFAHSIPHVCRLEVVIKEFWDLEATLIVEIELRKT